MTAQARVRDVEALRELAADLKRFAATAPEIVDDVGRSLQISIEALNRKSIELRTSVRTAEVRLSDASVRLRLCKESCSPDDSAGETSCCGEQAAVDYAMQELGRAEQADRQFQRVLARVHSAVERYRRSAARLEGLIDTSTKVASSILQSKYEALVLYLNVSPTGGAGASSVGVGASPGSAVRRVGSLAISVSPGIRARWGAHRSEIIARARESVRTMVRDPAAKGHNQILKHFGEDFGVREWACAKLNVINSIRGSDGSSVEFDQAYHGFDHVGVLSDGKVAVFEAKCYSNIGAGERPGLDQMADSHVDKNFERMSTQGYKQYSSSNEQLVRRAREYGYERYLLNMDLNAETVSLYHVTIDPKTGEAQSGEPICTGNLREVMGEYYDFYFGGSGGD